MPAGANISSWRLLPVQFVELPPSGNLKYLLQLQYRVIGNLCDTIGEGMSALAEGCRAAGLHALFMTAMKIYS